MGSPTLIATALFLVIAASTFSSTLNARSKTDRVVLDNGDRLHGEIRSLQRGILTLKTDWLGTVQIEWQHIREVQSEFFYEIILVDGQRKYGSIQPGQEDKRVGVVGQVDTYDTELLEVVSITPIEKQFFSRIKYSIEFGANYYSSNQSSQVSLGTDFKYRTENYGASADYNTLLNQQKDATRTRRNELQTSFQKFFSNNWSAMAIANFLQSEELNLDLRSVLGGGVTREVIQTNNIILTVLGGAAINRERYFEESIQTSVEGLSGIRFETFRFDKPELDVTASLFAIPSLSDWGRIRLEFDAGLRFKLFRDLYWNASLFENYDSRPPEGNQRNDFGVQTTFGWTFN